MDALRRSADRRSAFETLVTEPGLIFSAITAAADVKYVLLLLVPTAFLALGQPLLLIAVLPQLGINLMSDFWSTTQPMFQYVAAIVPVLIAATVMSVGRFPADGAPGSHVRRCSQRL